MGEGLGGDGSGIGCLESVRCRVKKRQSSPQGPQEASDAPAKFNSVACSLEKSQFLRLPTSYGGGVTVTFVSQVFRPNFRDNILGFGF